jgi:hypothetical protein
LTFEDTGLTAVGCEAVMTALSLESVRAPMGSIGRASANFIFWKKDNGVHGGRSTNLGLGANMIVLFDYSVLWENNTFLSSETKR